MFEHLAERFAEILTKGDVHELFRLLEQRYGTISEVCERIGIERRTFYHWRNAKQINVETKVKVLRVALEEHPIDTLEFLARKSRGRTREILEYLIELLRNEILSEENPEKLEALAKKTEEIINEYSIPVIEFLRHEVSNLIEVIHSKGYRLKVSQIIPVGILEVRAVKAPPESSEWTSSAATTYRHLGEAYGNPSEEIPAQFKIIEEVER